MPLRTFHPAVAAWFRRTFDEPTEPQRRGWPAIRSGRHTLIAAPTGSGKTLAAFLTAIDDLVRLGLERGLEDRTRVLYVSPLKALSNDVRKNLRIPLEGIACELVEAGLEVPEIRTQVRTGDTPRSERQAMVRRPPHILVTTPESLYLLLTSDGGRSMLGDVRTVIVDEIHAVADDRRGSHLALTLERLQALVERPLVRIGLSATQKPLEEVARFLVGARHVDADGTPDCEIVDAAGSRRLELDVELPDSPMEALMAGEVWDEVYDRLAERIGEHRTTLVFVNTRRVAERIARHLSERLGEDAVTSHHGSLSREARLDAERRLKDGELRALVATASLELGIDIGAIDLVIQMGSPRSINTLLQRVGRASHHVGGVPAGLIFPLSRDDLVESIAAIAAIRDGQLDRLAVPDRPVDILAQQIVAAAASREWAEEELYELMRGAWPYRDLGRQEFDDVVDMLVEGFTTRRGQRGRYLHLDAVNGRIRGRRGARLTALTCGGAIPDSFEFRVVQDPQDIVVGNLAEDFSVESMPGDIFQLGNASWRILKVEGDTVRVQDARGQPPTIPFWLGEAPGRTRELSEAVSALRAGIDRALGDDGDDLESATAWVRRESGVGEVAARSAVEYLAAARTALGVMPTRETIVLERFFDEAGDMHLVVHSPHGIRVNRAWGLALRKVFCRTFNFELQAAANDDALVLSLGPTHSFPLEDVFQYLKPGQVRDKLVQAFLDAPLFPVRWRWTASRSLAIKRFVSGKRVAPQLQRMDAEDLLAVVFPDQLACLENIQGDREIPDHPLVEQTIRDCLQEAMDFAELEEVLGAMAAGERRLVARDVREPSPLAQEILTAPPYAFLDDAPAEERRTLAVRARRFADPESADDLSALDADAIVRVRQQAWPLQEGPAAEDATGAEDELHDALLLHAFVAAAELEGEWPAVAARLVEGGRATFARFADGPRLLVAAERTPWLRTIAGTAELELLLTPEVSVPERWLKRADGVDSALVEMVRGRLQALGPVTVAAIAASMGLPEGWIEGALLALEAEGFVFRGRFSPGAEATEWCERRLLARIHRYTLNRLRAEIEPVPPAVLMRFLLRWQRVDAESRAEGPESLQELLEQLEGFEAPAAAWESEILPARLGSYDPVWLDTLCLAGRFAWMRLTPPGDGPRRGPRSGPIRTTPVALLARERTGLWDRLAPRPTTASDELSWGARSVLEILESRGACFFADLARETKLLDSQLEEALGELVAWGRVTSDSYTGLRALLVPADRRRSRSRRPGQRSVASFGMDNAGRWSLARRPGATEEVGGDDVERVARLLLRRYGVVFRRLLQRESNLPPWRELIRAYYRLEARGEIRGGRFVAGFSGEQFAHPEAVAQLRAARRREPEGELVSLSAADPLNLLGVLTAGDRLPALVDNRVLYRDGIAVAVREAGQVRFLEDVPAESRWELESALVRRRVPPRLRPYLGRSA